MYKAETNRWVKIQYTRNGKPFFFHKGKRISMNLVVKCHNNPWIGEGNFPDHIHGYYAEDVFNPLFVQVNNNGTAVKVFICA